MPRVSFTDFTAINLHFGQEAKQTNNQVKSSCCCHHKSHYILLTDSLVNDKPGLMPRPMCIFLFVSIIAPPQTAIIKAIAGKTVTFHISALSWLSKRCLSEMCWAEEKQLWWKCIQQAAGVALCLPLGLCGLTLSCRKTKISSMSVWSLQLCMDFDQKCDVLMLCSHLSEKQGGRHLMTKSTWQMQHQSLSEKAYLLQ